MVHTSAVDGFGTFFVLKHIRNYLSICLFACLLVCFPTLAWPALLNDLHHTVSEEYLERLILLLQYISPDQLQLDQMIREILEEGRESFRHLGRSSATDNASVSDRGSLDTTTITGATAGNGGGSSLSSAATSADNLQAHDHLTSGDIFGLWWKLFMTILLLGFFIGCISHFAQYYQMTIDQEDSNKLRQRLPHNVKAELTSPNSGRLKLPPPTAMTNLPKLGSNKSGKGNESAVQQKQQQSEQYPDHVVEVDDNTERVLDATGNRKRE